MPNSTETTPRVTVGLPVYNGEQYLAEAIDSILSQSFRDFELIISDNASTDGTKAICERYAALDPRVRYDRCEINSGAARNYNRLVEMARGAYFKWQAHDDNCYPDFLAECVPVLDREPDVVLCYPLTHVIDDVGDIMSEHRDGLELRHNAPHERLSTYLRKNFVRRQGLCNPIFGVIRISELRKTRLIQDFLASDLTLLAHLTLLGKFVEVSSIQFQRRVHAGISTMANRTFSERLAWFNTSAASRRGGKWWFNNHLAMRLTHIGDFYRAIRELVDGKDERRRCRYALTKIIVLDPMWIYRDIKYSLGFTPGRRRIIQNLKQSNRANSE